MNNLDNALQEHFGFSGFRRGQREVIQRIVSGRSAAAIFPTGAGKSLCYQLPALLQPHLTLVVSPLLSLMKDQLDFLSGHGIPAARLDSSLNREEQNRIVQDAVGGDLKILMISVERFKNERFRARLRQMRISLLVVDEAHCISEWGHNFRPEYLRLPEYRREFGMEKTLLLTATATRKVSSDMCAKFDIPEEDLVRTGFYRPNLYLKVSPLREGEKKGKLLKDLAGAPQGGTIVYVTLQKRAEELSAYLSANGLEAAAYHGGMKNEDRVRIQNLFMGGKVPCVVATIAFGMGIDKRDIRRVVHYDLPKSIENYSQEIGRAGRDGNPSVCEVYGSRSNLCTLENFVYGDTPSRMAVSALLEEIKGAGSLWEFKALSLGKDVNIRPLPLKTLLVYLSMMKVISPKYSYFEEFSFKFLDEKEAILDRFRGERADFVRLILDNCRSKRVWSSVDMETLTGPCGADRKRVLAALDYFDSQNWIELSASQAVEVYDVLDPGFDGVALGERLYALFKEKEESEIRRIHNMIDFFQGDSCLSRRLAAYFGETLEEENCGHCSICAGERALLQDGDGGKDLSRLDREELCSEAARLLGGNADPESLARFLCGMTSPLFTRLKLRRLSSFGALEEYPFMTVKDWLASG